LLQIINPAIIVVLTSILPCIPFMRRRSTITLLLMGTILQATSSLWIWLLGGTITGVVLYLVQFTMGEAIGWPHLGDFQLSIIPKGSIGFYRAVGQLPTILLNFGNNALSAAYLTWFCADAKRCKEDNAPWLWFCVSLLAIATPLSLVIYYTGILKPETRSRHRFR